MTGKPFEGTIKYRHPSLGYLTVVLSHSYRRVTGRWTKGMARVSMPPVGEDEMRRLVDNMAPRLLARRPATPDFSPDRVIEAPGMRISFAVSGAPVMTAKADFRRSDSLIECIITYGGAIDLSLGHHQKFLSRFVLSACGRMWPHIILPRAEAIARDLCGRKLEWRMGTGTRTLGSCSSRGVITLSQALVLMPQELRDYVIKHELAHLVEFNHQAGFHALLNRYCDGREQEYEKMLKNFSWPIVR